MEQFSFSNNLLLTISIATLGYFYKEGKEEFRGLTIWRPFSGSLDVEATLFSVGAIFIGISIGYGLIVTLARLFDFRLTRHITLIRKRIYIEHVKVIPDEPLRAKKFLESFCDLIKILFCYKKIKISQSECQKFDDSLKSKFLNLRATTNGFGDLSWVAFNFQFCFFLFGLLSYEVLMFIRIMY